jgi:hypothetical protein
MISGAAVVAIGIGVVVFLYGGENFSNTSPSTTNTAQLAVVAISFTKLAQGVKSTVSTRTNYLITSASELEKLWQMVDARGKTPVIDFTKNYVAAVFAGKVPTTGYAIAVSKVEDTNVRIVTVTLTKPESGCIEGQLITSPYALIELPKTSLQFTHEDQTATTNCSQ